MTRIRRFFSLLLSTLSALVVLAFAIYTAGWFFLAWTIQQQIDTIWADQDRYEITISGEKPQVSGFPAPPRLVFAGSVTDRNGLIYEAPEFVYQGFPLPTQATVLKAPRGITFSGPILKLPVHLDTFLLQLRVPAGFPARLSGETVAQWQKSGGSLPVEALHLTRGKVSLSGDGYLNLDPALQPAGYMTVRIAGLDDLLNELAANGTIGERQALMAQSLINLMSQKDESSGESWITTALTIQQGAVFLGPLRVASLPEWRWNTGNPPAPR